MTPYYKKTTEDILIQIKRDKVLILKVHNLANKKVN